MWILSANTIANTKSLVSRKKVYYSTMYALCICLSTWNSLRVLFAFHQMVQNSISIQNLSILLVQRPMGKSVYPRLLPVVRKYYTTQHERTNRVHHRVLKIKEFIFIYGALMKIALSPWGQKKVCDHGPHSWRIFFAQINWTIHGC